MRQVDITGYYPPTVSDKREFRQIGAAESPELVAAWQVSDDIRDNQYLFTSNEYGVRRREQMLELLPEPGDTLDERKLRIYMRDNDRLPYSWRMLLEKLDALCGEDGYTAEMYPEIYWVHVDLKERNRDFSKTVWELLRLMLPANQEWTVSITFPTTFKTENHLHTVGLTVWQSASNWGRNPVLFDGRVRFDGSILFDQQVAGRLRLEHLDIHTRAKNPMAARPGYTLAQAVKQDYDHSYGLYLTGAAAQPLGMQNRYRLRSSAIQHWRSPSFHLKMGAAAKQRSDHSFMLSVEARARLVQAMQTRLQLLAGAKQEWREPYSILKTAFATRQANTYSYGLGAFTKIPHSQKVETGHRLWAGISNHFDNNGRMERERDHTFDGSWNFDGYRRFDAMITKEEF